MEEDIAKIGHEDETSLGKPFFLHTYIYIYIVYHKIKYVYKIK